MDIEEVLDRHDSVLVDTCVFSIPNSLISDLYKDPISSKFNYGKLEEGIRIADYMIDILSHDRVYVIPEVNDEISHLDRIMFKCMIKNKRSSKLGKRDETYNFGDNLLSKLNHKVAEIHSVSKHHMLAYFDREFTTLYDIVSLISLTGNLKREKKPGKRYRDTDEKLVTYGLYDSIFNKKSTAILTRDHDLINILHAACKTLKSRFLNPSSDYVAESFDNKPVTVYFKEEKDIIETLSTSKLTNPSIFQLHSLSYQENYEVMQRAAILFNSINPAPNQVQQSLPQQV